MSRHTYQKDFSLCRNLSPALIAAGFSRYHHVENTDTEITLIFDEDLTQEQSDELDSFVANYDGPLELAKEAAKNSIDARTRELLRQGFTYEGETFSLSDRAQLNWNRLVAHNAAGKLSFPFNKISTKRGGRCTLQGKAAFDAFEAAYFAAIDSVLEGGRVLRDQINAATTVEAVGAVVDDREFPA